MYAVLKTGGKQYKVCPGDILRVEKLTAKTGSEIQFTEVLFLREDGNLNLNETNKSTKPNETNKKSHEPKSFIGHPVVEGAKIKALVLDQGKGKKILVFKKKRRKSYRKTQGHRQKYSDILIQSIQTPDGTVYKDLNPKKKTTSKGKRQKKEDIKKENTKKEMKPKIKEKSSQNKEKA